MIEQNIPTAGLDMYQSLAIQTESLPTDHMVNRLAQVRKQMMESFSDIQRASVTLDAIKKYIFYNKPSRDLHVPSYMAYSEAEQKIDVQSSWYLKLRVLHAVLGLLSEADEYIVALLPLLDNKGHAFDPVNFQEEMGDNLWYAALALDAIGCTFGACARANIAKLEARYGKKFDIDRAKNRSLEVESEEMKKALAATKE